MLPNMSSTYTQRKKSLLVNLVQVHVHNDDEMDGRPPRNPKKYNKFDFREICDSLNNINEKYYQHFNWLQRIKWVWDLLEPLPTWRV